MVIKVAEVVIWKGKEILIVKDPKRRDQRPTIPEFILGGDTNNPLFLKHGIHVRYHMAVSDVRKIVSMTNPPAEKGKLDWIKTDIQVYHARHRDTYDGNVITKDTPNYYWIHAIQAIAILKTVGGRSEDDPLIKYLIHSLQEPACPTKPI